MNIRIVAAVALATTFGLGLVACNSGTGLPSAVGGTSAGSCSDPHPSFEQLTFAAVVCVNTVTRVRQPDGSTELELRISITNKDPNTFGVTGWDFQVLDSAGHDVPTDDAREAGRTGAGRCVFQDITDDGWPLKPGATFTVPGPYCFNLTPGEQPKELVWQDDVPVPIPSR